MQLKVACSDRSEPAAKGIVNIMHTGVLSLNMRGSQFYKVIKMVLIYPFNVYGSSVRSLASSALLAPQMDLHRSLGRTQTLLFFRICFWEQFDVMDFTYDQVTLCEQTRCKRVAAQEKLQPSCDHCTHWLQQLSCIV